MRSNFDDMLICDVATVGDYNYYGYVSAGEDSRYVIVREKTDESEYRYTFGSGSNYAVDFANKANLCYVLPNTLKGRS